MRKNTSQQVDAIPAQDQLDLLMDGDKEIRKLFKAFDNIEDKENAGKKVKLAMTICHEIMVQAQIEEKNLAPSVRAAIDENGMAGPMQ